jgi:uncharacterized protein
MTQFRISTIAPDGSNPVLLYDNMTSALTWEDGNLVSPVKPPVGHIESAIAVSMEHPGLKSDVKTLKISLGLSCNYECNYCSQRFVPHAESSNSGDIEVFVTQLTGALSQAPQRIEFWGGEPLVYWKTLKPLAERLRVMYPDASFNIITNGSLLDTEKNRWLDELGFGVGISHDGPGYHARGADPLDNADKRAAIMDLYARLKPQGRISINAMMHKGNQSRAAVQTWLQNCFGDDVAIGEGAFIDPYDDGGMAATLNGPAEQIGYRSMAFAELRTGQVACFDIAYQKVMDFVGSVRNARPARALGQKCGMDRPDNLAVDLHGNVITCQNVSAAAIAPNGQPHNIGHISNLQAVKLKTSTHWSERGDCPNCPVLQLCKGSCMFLEGALWDAGCDAAYSDNIPFFAAAIEFMTGAMPVYIEGDFRSDRKDIFGMVDGVPSAKVAHKIIPIAVA